MSARGLVEQVLDAGSWSSWDLPPNDPAAPGSPYAEILAQARKRTGYDEAVITGAGALRGRRVAFVVSEFSFLAGSIGVGTAERIVAAIERATAEGLPLLAAPSSGGTRMQEGTIAFVQMARITAAVMRHRAAALPYLVYLRHPTTGGVLASWGSLGHLTAAEPGALIGFLGPRVSEALVGKPFPPGVQVAENLATKGLVDAVVPVDQLADVASRALNVLAADTTSLTRGAARPLPDQPVLADVPAWESILLSRRDDRPGIHDLLRQATEVTPLSGTGEGESDPGLVLALAKFGQVPCVVVGQSGRPLGPGGLRVARRGMRLSRDLGLPLLTVVDTPGAVLSPDAEEKGLAGEIARCLAELTTLTTPTVCLLLGEGSGGAALALLPARRVLCAEHAWLSPLPPEGASVIMHRTTERAAEMAQAQGVRSADLLAHGIAHRIIPEDAAFCARTAEIIEQELLTLMTH